jgi:hypothetical protein
MAISEVTFLGTMDECEPVLSRMHCVQRIFPVDMEKSAYTYLCPIKSIAQHRTQISNMQKFTLILIHEHPLTVIDLLVLKLVEVAIGGVK